MQNFGVLPISANFMMRMFENGKKKKKFLPKAFCVCMLVFEEFRPLCSELKFLCKPELDMARVHERKRNHIRNLTLIVWA